jgi:nucleotide-binding universal stress UspA family protein
MKKLLVPIDGTDHSNAALAVADRLAIGLDAEAVLVFVAELPETSAQQEDAVRNAESKLERARERLTARSRIRVETTGDPARGILQAVEAEHPDMIVMSTHGRSGLMEIAQGSVASEIVRAGVAPVTLVKPDDE